MPFAMLWCLTACGASEPAPKGPAAAELRASGGEQAEPTPPAQPPAAPPSWSELGPKERAEYMAQTVVPTLEPLFQQFDAERFAEFDCTTCHGANAQEVEYQMPNGLSPLVPAQLPAMFESEQPMAKFMTGTVWPKMSELLDKQPFDPGTGEGFSCLNCHAAKVE